MAHFFNIERHNGSALVQIIEIIKSADGDVHPGKCVQEYETASAGATRSARKAIKKLQAV